MSLRATISHHIPIGEPLSAENRGGIDLEHERQDDDRWCWAACVEMVLKQFHLSDDEQCTIAQEWLQVLSGVPVKCCDNQKRSNDSPNCDVLLTDNQITRLWERRGLEAERIPRFFIPEPLRLDLVKELKERLDAGQPVQLKYHGGTLDHVVMLFAWERVTDDQINFFYNDPLLNSKVSIKAEHIIENELRPLRTTWTIKL